MRAAVRTTHISSLGLVTSGHSHACSAPRSSAQCSTHSKRELLCTATLRWRCFLRETNASITEMAAATRRSRKASDPPPCTPAGDNDELRARIREASLKLKNALSCPVCHDWFEDPIALGCGHALCRACAVNWLKTTPSCPTCRAAADPRGAARRDVARDLARAVAAARPCVAMAGTPGPKKRGRES